MFRLLPSAALPFYVPCQHQAVCRDGQPTFNNHSAVLLWPLVCLQQHTNLQQHDARGQPETPVQRAVYTVVVAWWVASHRPPHPHACLMHLSSACSYSRRCIQRSKTCHSRSVMSRIVHSRWPSTQVANKRFQDYEVQRYPKVLNPPLP